MSAIVNKSLLTKCHLACVRVFCTTDYNQIGKSFADEINSKPDKINESDDKKLKRQNQARSIKVLQHFRSKPHLNDVKDYIPTKYFLPKQRLTPRHLYLADGTIAKSVVSCMRPFLLENQEQIVCETNAGLGLITSELLEKGIPLVRLYETCPEFRLRLKNFNARYPNRVELFVKDIFHLSSLYNMDKYDNGDRVQQLLRGVPKRRWSDDPVMTIVGPLPNLGFIRYLIRMLSLQQGIVTYGRIQIFALMKPMDYMKITATPNMGLHVYQVLTALFQLFFESELLEKYSRKSFLPWETKPKNDSRLRAHSKFDVDFVYLVRLNLKREFPVEAKYIMHLYYFLTQCFLQGKKRVIPIVEKWLPDIGVNLIAPGKKPKDKCFPNMNIFTEFGNLSPTQLLQIFLEMVEHPGYESSPFAALVEAQLLKSETIESDLANARKSHHVENLEENLS